MASKLTYEVTYDDFFQKSEASRLKQDFKDNRKLPHYKVDFKLVKLLKKRAERLLERVKQSFFCSTSLPLASTRWV